MLFGLLVLVYPFLIDAWGTDGHKAVASIAHSLLSQPAREAVDKLLPSWESLVSVSTWADDAAHTEEYAWSKCMHFVDTDTCGISDQDKNCGCCVIKAIANYTTRLGNTDLGNNDRYEALKFLVHFVGDASQPLHAGHTQDRGGNLVHVTIGWAGHTSQGTNLHSVWDSNMLEHKLHANSWTFQTFASGLVKRIQAGEFPASEWSKDCDGLATHVESCPVDSSEESAETACEFAYTDEHGNTIISGSVLSSQYYESRIPVLERRIAAAGVRLASILNGVLGKPNSIVSQLSSDFPLVNVI
jgi:hypothetical protein